MHISGVQTVLPDYRYAQAEITEAFSRLTEADLDQLERFHAATGVQSRNLALPLDDYAKLDSFGRANDITLRSRSTWPNGHSVVRWTRRAYRRGEWITWCSARPPASPRRPWTRG